MCQGGRKSSHIKGILHDRKVARREKVENRNQEIIGKCEEDLREEEMHRREVKHIREERKPFIIGKKRKHARETEIGSDRH